MVFMVFNRTTSALMATFLVGSKLSAFAFSLSKAHIHLPTTPTTSLSTETTRLSLAFGLPDEDRKLPQPDDAGKIKESSVTDDTLNSLVEKLEKSKDTSEKPKKNDNKSMAFLKKIGRIGGAANKSFVNAVGSDEGTAGRQPPVDRSSTSEPAATRKSNLAYKECTDSGVVDDMSEPFPITSSGTEWRGITDRVMGGQSNGLLKRVPDLNGRPANVLEGHVSLRNNGGFLQMVTDLPLDASKPFVDASKYDGIEFDILYRQVEKEAEEVDEERHSKEDNPGMFNMHVRTPGTFQQASYRYTFKISKQDTWETVRVPFSSFEAYRVGPDMPSQLDPSELRRIGIVGIGREMDIFLACGGLRFYSVF